MKSLKIKFLWLLLVLVLPVLCFAESCESVDLIQYKPVGDCGTSERKCCANKHWSDWGGECSGTPCPSSCENGLYLNPKVHFEEEGPCCVNACQIPELRNTCKCYQFALGPGLCNCFKNDSASIKQFAHNDLCDGLSPEAAGECERDFLERYIMQGCYHCPGFLESSDTRQLCCTSMGGSLDPRDNKCYSNKLSWQVDYNDRPCSSPALCYSGHCSVLMTPVASQGCLRYAACKSTTSPCSKEGYKCQACTTRRRPELDKDWCKGGTGYASFVYTYVCTKESKLIFE